MATVKTADGWMTSFIYEQDLTSAYMNSVLYSLFRPGIYNANFILKRGFYSKDGDGLSLFIKKGTTFVFSNDYINIYEQSDYYDSGYPLYRRSFTCDVPNSASNDEPKSLIGGNLPIIVKCVAMRDILISGIAQSATGLAGDLSCQPWGGAEGDPDKEKYAPDVLYLCAFMRYDQTGARKNFTTVPIFLLTRNNPYYGKTMNSIYYGNSSSIPKDPLVKGDYEYNRDFYFHTHQDWIDYDTSKNGAWRVPDGATSDGNINYGSMGLESMTQLGYLMLGVLVDNSKTPIYEEFNSDWFRKHTFTARCLPEYRNNMIGASDTPFPDYIIPYKYSSDSGHNFGRLYVDFKNVLNFGNIYNTSIDWESAYGIAPSTTESGFWSFSPLSGSEYEDYVSLELSESEILKLANSDTTDTKNVSLVMDFTFAVTKNVMNSVANLDGKEDMFDNQSFSKNNKIKLFNHREIIDLSLNKEYSGDDYDKIIKYVQIITSSAESSSEDTSKVQLKLDICDNNSRRLLDLLKNNNILYRVINKIRSNGSLDAELGESLIPVAVSFRLLGKASKTDSTGVVINPLDWGRTDWSGSSASQDYKDRCANLAIAKDRTYETVKLGEDDIEYYIINFVGDKISSPYSVNPLNSIGLLDLEYKMTKMNAISTKTQNAYTVIPVID